MFEERVSQKTFETPSFYFTPYDPIYSFYIFELLWIEE